MNLRRYFLATILAGAGACVAGWTARAQSPRDGASAVPGPPPPSWAYPIATTEPLLSVSQAPYHLKGSPAAFTFSESHNLFVVPDWYPDSHPPMPEVVRHGRRPSLYACGYCHFPNGQGRPENAALAGLSVDYIVRQLADFQGGMRTCSEPRMDEPGRMITVAQLATPEEVEAAARYFSKLQYQPWIKVVETETVPRTAVVGPEFKPVGRGRTEPIGRRIIEIAEDFERTTLRDPTSGFVAYVPVGSVQEGERLVSTGGAGRTVQCASCHGPQLKGLDPAPPLAGRSPSYVVRQLYDIQSGKRTGKFNQLMVPAVAALTVDEMISIAAYLASCRP